jgi:hypothetical protein
MFITTKHDEGKISESILELINALIDIISIAYSPESKRYPRQILRLFNACFKFGVIAKTVFGSPKKMTTRKFFGSQVGHCYLEDSLRKVSLVCLEEVSIDY